MMFLAPTASAGASGSSTFTVTHGFKGSDEEYYRAIKDHSKLFEATF